MEESHGIPICETKMGSEKTTALKNYGDEDDVELSSDFAHEINDTNKMNNPINKYNLLYIEVT